MTGLTVPTDRSPLDHREECERLSRRFAGLFDGLERGFVAEHEEHQEVEGEDRTARRLWLCETAEGRIVEAVGFCTGEWDEELRARHAVEAPMLRPWNWCV